MIEKLEISTPHRSTYDAVTSGFRFPTAGFSSFGGRDAATPVRGRYQDRRMIDELAQLAWLKPAALGRGLVGDPSGPAALVYGGDRSFTREGITVYRWSDL